MVRYLTLTAAAVVLLSFAGPVIGAPPKDKPDPDRRVLVVEKDGEKIGELSYKWVRTASGNEFASSKTELKTGGSKYIIRTHLKRRADGVVEKYKKWIGLEGAKPDVIAFWKDDKIRTVSKIPNQKFTRTFDPPETFAILDEMGFHLYRDFVRSWRRDGDGGHQVLTISDGRFVEVAVSGAGTAEVTRKEKARTMDVIAVEIAGQRTLIYADDKDELWGIIAPGLTLTKGGWTLGAVQAPVAAPPVSEPGSDPVSEPGKDGAVAPGAADPSGPTEEVGAGASGDADPSDPAADPKLKPLPID